MNDTTEHKVGDWMRLCVGTLHGKVVEVQENGGAGGRTLYRVWLPLPPRDMLGNFTAEELIKVSPGIPSEQTAEAAGVDLTLDPNDILASYSFK